MEIYKDKTFEEIMNEKVSSQLRETKNEILYMKMKLFIV